ncbi:MAG: HAMP domain-containing histidine kinase [Alphaproteobacteria bacterium]|uniref:histidine kinase n=1 Tax=Candidatus Nitrobium versatile TaxID=2884831 RepID=A0A953LXJ5_9BACT|nr:HAMP domain-containing histidine kinase [Candidatus Nitrobium versatile]
MKTKIFLAFIAVITAALFSNFVFHWLIIKDFDNYVKGVKEDQFYWVLAMVEDSYDGGRWHRTALSETIHWAMMIGLDIRIIDKDGGEVISSHEVLDSLSGTMMKRMHDLFHIQKTTGSFERYPLYLKGEQVGTLLTRPFQKEALQEKELIFKERAKDFIYISLLIAGGGALIIALLFSQYLTKPITLLKDAAEKIAKGDFSIRIRSRSRDEVGELSESFNRMAASLQKEESLRTHLMSNIAHELRTPLTIMKTHSEAVMDGVIEDCGKGMENIHAEIDRLIKLVKGIEDITTAEASFFSKGEKVEVDMGEFLSGLADEMRPLFREKGLSLTTAARERALIVADVEKLERIVRNILSNALKYTEKGGVQIDYGKQGDDFFVEVSDSGRGIPEQEIPLIFNRFYRVEGSGNGGLGLGLSIVKELVEVMGGRIEVRSRVNEGSCFRVYLHQGDRR